MSINRGRTCHSSLSSTMDLPAPPGAAHWPGVDGWCAGCAAVGVLQFYPCPWVRWALDGRVRVAGSVRLVQAGRS